jgi:hypothetical protein
MTEVSVRSMRAAVMSFSLRPRRSKNVSTGRPWRRRSGTLPRDETRNLLAVRVQRPHPLSVPGSSSQRVRDTLPFRIDAAIVGQQFDVPDVAVVKSAVPGVALVRDLEPITTGDARY